MLKVLEPYRHKPALAERVTAVFRRLPGFQHGAITVIRARRRLGLFKLSFIVCVLAPTLVTGIYFGLIASPLYYSEARLAVRTASDANAKMGASAASLMSALSTAGPASQDAFIVGNYIKSRTIIEDLGGRNVIQTIYSRPEIDWFSRLSESQPLEKIWRYWRRKVTVSIDTPTGIITLETYAFKPADAKSLGDLIIKHSELLVNRISERSRSDALQRAIAEVELAQTRLKQARDELLRFRNQSNLLDPRFNTTTIGATLQQLLKDKFALENDIASVRGSMSPDAPTLQIYNARMAKIDQQIAALREQLTSQKENSALSELMTGYEERQLHVMFAEKLYAVAETSYVRAREELAKQQLYLVTIVRPTLPEENLYLRPLIITGLVLSVSLILWSMISLVIASIRDHME